MGRWRRTGKQPLGVYWISQSRKIWEIMDQKPLESRLHKCYWLSSLPTIFPLFQKIYFTEVQLIYNVLISTAQQSDSVIHIYFSYYFPVWPIAAYWKQFLMLHSRTLCLSILCIIVYIHLSTVSALKTLRSSGFTCWLLLLFGMRVHIHNNSRS